MKFEKIIRLYVMYISKHIQFIDTSVAGESRLPRLVELASCLPHHSHSHRSLIQAESAPYRDTAQTTLLSSDTLLPSPPLAANTLSSPPSVAASQQAPQHFLLQRMLRSFCPQKKTRFAGSVRASASSHRLDHQHHQHHQDYQHHQDRHHHRHHRHDHYHFYRDESEIPIPSQTAVQSLPTRRRMSTASHPP